MEYISQLNMHVERVMGWPVWDRVLWGNTYGEYALALGALFAFLIVFKIVQMIIISRLRVLAERTKTDIDDTLIKIVSSLRPPFYTFLAFYLALFFIDITSWIQTTANAALIIWVVYQIMVAFQILIDYVIQKKLAIRGEGGAPQDETRASALRLFGSIIKGVLWAVAILLILSNLGVNITSLVAGLGIGGLAIAFALQNILADLFSSFSIYFDRPFNVGDLIMVGDAIGTVEKIGIKTTRLRALQGEELVVSNQELTSAQIHNYGKMEQRRNAFILGVAYETPHEKLKRIPDIIKDIIKKNEDTTLEWVHFKDFGDSALRYEVVYYAQTSDYYEYMDIQERINLAIKEAFDKEEIELAYPTRTVYLHK